MEPPGGMRWLDRLIARHPFRSVIISFLISGALFLIGYLIHLGALYFVGALVLILSLFLLVYAFIRKAMDISAKRKPVRARRPVDPTEMETLSRGEAVENWRERARREEMEKAIDKAKRRK